MVTYLRVSKIATEKNEIYLQKNATHRSFHYIYFSTIEFGPSFATRHASVRLALDLTMFWKYSFDVKIHVLAWTQKTFIYLTLAEINHVGHITGAY